MNRNERRTIPSLRALMELDEKGQSSTEWRRTLPKRKAIVGNLAADWSQTLELVDLRKMRKTPELNGKRLDRHTVLANAEGATVTNCVVFSRFSAFPANSHLKVEDSLIVAGSALGYSRRGANAPEFDDIRFRHLLTLADGIKSGNSRNVEDSLAEIMETLGGYELGFKGLLYGDKDSLYKASYGDLASAAKVVDTYWVPAITMSETRDVFVSNSVLYGSVDVLPGVLGGEIKDSVVATKHRAFANAHCKARDIVILNGSERMDIKRGSFGFPDLAADVVHAYAELPAMPLERLAA